MSAVPWRSTPPLSLPAHVRGVVIVPPVRLFLEARGPADRVVAGARIQHEAGMRHGQMRLPADHRGRAARGSVLEAPGPTDRSVTGARLEHGAGMCRGCGLGGYRGCGMGGCCAGHGAGQDSEPGRCRQGESRRHPTPASPGNGRISFPAVAAADDAHRSWSHLCQLLHWPKFSVAQVVARPIVRSTAETALKCRAKPHVAAGSGGISLPPGDDRRNTGRPGLRGRST